MSEFLGIIEKASLKSFKEFKVSPSISGGTLTIDLSSGSLFYVTLNANITTLSITNPVSTYSDAIQGFTLILAYTSTTYTVNWTGITWPGGSAPTLTNSNGKRDVFSFLTYDGGTTWLGFVGGQNY